MNKLNILLVGVTLAALAAVGYADTRSAQASAKAPACCPDGACCGSGSCCCR